MNKELLLALNIYPLSNNPTFEQLYMDENKIIERSRPFQTRRTWTKLYQLHDSEKIPVKAYLWESGIGQEHFIKQPENEGTTVTFGSFIDPLSKPGKAWPPNGQSIHIDPSFMKLIGFGSSEIRAQTVQNGFRYHMKIGCGTPCSGNSCTLTGDQQDEVYFKGNNEKNKFLKQLGKTKEKNIYAVIKEWGDKIQTILYYMLYHTNRLKNTTTVMSTCDIVVYVLCLILNIRCIFTGKYDRKSNIPTTVIKPGKGTYYSIVDFNPSSPLEMMYQQVMDKISRTIEENIKVINQMEYLRTHPSIMISVQGTMDRMIRPDFYEKMIQDMTRIQVNLTMEKESVSPPQKHTKLQDYKQWTEKKMKQIDDEYLLIPPIKKRGNRLFLSHANSYTLHRNNRMKPAFDNRTNTFYTLSLEYPAIVGQQRGGAGEMPSMDDLSQFHESHSSPILFTEKVVHPLYVDEGEEKEDAPLYMEHHEEKMVTIDLQQRLNETFMSAWMEYVKFAEIPSMEYEHLYETLYTLYIYQAQRDGMASISVSLDDIDSLYRSYVNPAGSNVLAPISSFATTPRSQHKTFTPRFSNTKKKSQHFFSASRSQTRNKNKKSPSRPTYANIVRSSVSSITGTRKQRRNFTRFSQNRR